MRLYGKRNLNKFLRRFYMPRDKIDDLVKNEVLRGIVIRAIITLSLFTVISKSVSMTINMPNYNLL